jgi:DNA-binding NarL/FixJ family response regulator
VTTVFLVDDHEVVRDGLRALLAAEDDLEVVGEAETVATATTSIRATRPDVALIDLNLPDGSGIEVCRALAPDLPGTRFLFLTSVADDDALLAAILAGADGYVLKHVRSADLVGAIRRLAAGEHLLSGRQRQHVVDRLRASARPHSDALGLSPQEHEVFELLAAGLTNRAIGDRLGLAEKTVKNYVSHLLVKLGMSRRTEAAVLAATLEEQHKRPARADARNPIRY